MKKTAPKAERRALHADVLEPRVLFSAAPAAEIEAPIESDIPAAAQEYFLDEACAERGCDTPPEAPEPSQSNEDVIASQEFEQAVELSQAANLLWIDSDLTNEQIEILQNVTYEISDLEDGKLAVTEGNVIRIDDDAAGLGWFVDDTPFENEEFSFDDSSGILFGNSEESLKGVDLLSILAHEQGHILGLNHVADLDSVMRAEFGTGMRLLPQLGQAHGSVAGTLEGLNFASTATGPATVSGTVFQDWNFDGTQADNPGFVEDGIENVIVTAYDADENIVFQVQTDANGDYMGTNAGLLALRLEFTNVPTGFSNSTADAVGLGADPNTVSSISFLTNPTQTTANLALYQPNNTAELVTTCFVFGLPENSSGDPAIVAFTTANPTDQDVNNMANGAQVTYLATIGQVGSTYGLAQNTNNEDLFTGTFQKRSSHYVDGITAVGAANRASNILFRLPGGSAAGGDTADTLFFAEVGTEPATTHDGTTSADLRTDQTGLGLVGKAGLGDVEISGDNSELYTINLHDRTLYTYDPNAPAGSAPTGTFDILTGIGEAGNNGASILGVNPEDNIRPFALSYNDADGLLYIGMVNSAQFYADGTAYNANLGHNPMDGSEVSANAVDGVADTIRINGHGFVSGDVVTFHAGAVGGLTVGVPYFVVVDDANNFHLATSSTNAAQAEFDITNGNPLTTVIDITDNGSGNDQFIEHIHDEDEPRSTDPHIVDNLRAIVYTFDPATGAFGPAPVANFSLNYERDEKLISNSLDQVTDWDPWVDVPEHMRVIDIGAQRLMGTTQPILTDIEFDSDGNMILGFRDRSADQYNGGSQSSFVGPGDTSLFISDTGVVLRGSERVRALGSGGDSIRLSAGSFTPEYHVTSGNDQNSEFFSDFAINASGRGGHLELFQGALASTNGGSALYSTILDPYRFGSGGVGSYDLVTGDRTGAVDSVPITVGALDGIELFQSPANQPGISKANGLGDLEYLNNLTMEIGNRVWIDVDADGIQDADEAGVANVTLQLHDFTDPLSPVLVGTTTTNARGEWYFNDSNVSYTDGRDPVGLRALTDYRVSVVAAEFTAGGDLDGLRVTQQNEHILLTGNQAIVITADNDPVTSQSRGQRIDILSLLAADGGLGAGTVGEYSDGKQVFLIDGGGNRVTQLALAGGILHVDENNTIILTPTNGSTLTAGNFTFDYEITEDRRDSDANTAGEIFYTTKYDGYTDHSLDIGVIRNNLELRKYVVDGGQLYDNDTNVTAGQVHAALNVGDTVEYALITAHNQTGIAYNPGASFNPTAANAFNVTGTGINLFDPTEPTSVSDAYNIVISDVVGDSRIDLVTGSIQVYRQEANGTVTTLALGTDYQLTESAAGGFVIEMGGTTLEPSLTGTRPDLSENDDVISGQSEALEVDNDCPKGFIVTYRGLLTGAASPGDVIPNTAQLTSDDLPSFNKIGTPLTGVVGSESDPAHISLISPTPPTDVDGSETDPVHIRPVAPVTPTPLQKFYIPQTDDPGKFNQALAEQGLQLFGGSDIFAGFRYVEPGVRGTPDPDERELPPVAIVPMYSGLVDPGTVLNIKIMGKGSERLLHGEMTIVGDAGGNWLAKFPDLEIGDEPHYIVIEQSRPTWNITDDEHGYNLRTYFAAPVSGSHSQVNPVSIEAVMGRRSTLLGVDQLNKVSHSAKANTDWRLGEHEFYCVSGIAGVQSW